MSEGYVLYGTLHYIGHKDICVCDVWTQSEGCLACRTFRYTGQCLSDIYCMGRFITLDTGIFNVCDVWTQSEGYLACRTFRYIGQCLRDIYCMGRFIILETGIFVCVMCVHSLRGIWHVERFVLLVSV
jgi:hypothetical protein